MNYLATFHTHYGAVRFYTYCKKNSIPAKMSPVPREVSASCGTCVCFTARHSPLADEHEDMDRCYTVTEDETYLPAEGK